VPTIRELIGLINTSVLIANDRRAARSRDGATLDKLIDDSYISTGDGGRGLRGSLHVTFED
jgi:hypothetical protein